MLAIAIVSMLTKTDQIDGMDTTMTIRASTKKRLGKRGLFQETYDELINRLLDQTEGKK
jgi:hypothetical protein